MKVVTFYADADLPDSPRAKQKGFDWRWAIGELSRTAQAKLNAETMIITDMKTPMQDGVFFRIGDARDEGIMLWLIDAQAAAVAAAEEPMLLVSPDTLIAGPLDVMFGDWDMCLLTRARPKPIVNSVISIVPGIKMARLWNYMAVEARQLPVHSKNWGADIDILVETLEIHPNEDAIREIHGVRVRLMPMASVFQSVDAAAQPRRLPVPIWDFKGRRKQLMPAYAALLQ